MLFGSSKPKEKTVLILDVESGSVGSGLVRTSNIHPPKLFGEKRVTLPVSAARNSTSLAHAVMRAADETIAHASEVASRLRAHPQTKDSGKIESASIFLSAPWGVPDLQSGKPTFLESLSRILKGLVGARAGHMPVSTHTHAGAMVRGMQVLFDTKTSILLCSLHGEVSELILLKNGSVAGHATVPIGFHSLLRTLKAHGDVSAHEARSLLRLAEHPPLLRETLSSAAAHFRSSFREAGEVLFGGLPIERVVVFARGPEAHFFARTLSHASLADLFPHGGVVQVLEAHHLTPFIAAHAPQPDTGLIMSALFVDVAK